MNKDRSGGLEQSGRGGNGLMVAAVVADRRLRTVTNTFMVSLAISDILIATVNMPVQLWYYSMSTTLRSSSRLQHLQHNAAVVPRHVNLVFLLQTVPAVVLHQQ